MDSVDLTQNPNDFLKTVTDPSAGAVAAPTDSKEQPAGNGEPPAAPPVVPPAEPPKVPPKEDKPSPSLPTTPEDSKEQPVVADKDAKEAAEKIRQLSETKKTYLETQVKVLDRNPDYIHDLQETNPELAAELIKEHWGYDSYEELMRVSRINDLEKDDPKEAERERRIFKIEQDNKMYRQQAIDNAEKAFLSEKGIDKNPFDPKYKALMEGLKNLNPEFVRTNYASALETSYRLSFPQEYAEEAVKKAQKDILLSKELGSGSGNPSVPTKQADANVPPEARAFAGLVGAPL